MSFSSSVFIRCQQWKGGQLVSFLRKVFVLICVVKSVVKVTVNPLEQANISNFRFKLTFNPFPAKDL